MEQYVITNAKVYAESGAIEKGFIRVYCGEITEIGSMASFVASENDSIVDYTVRCHFYWQWFLLF